MSENSFTLSPAPNAWPLLFKYRGPVLGKGFVALVTFHGRLLARPENGEIWFDGVNPGGFAFGAANIRAASAELRSTITGILVDIAEESNSFDEFRGEVERFFEETDAQTQGEWDACVSEVQHGRIKSPGLLPVESANSPLLVEVVLKPTEEVTPRDNTPQEPALAYVA
jgi:hypothetical protein